jgi:hypothetical protein
MGHRWPDGDKGALVCGYGEGEVVPEHSDHSRDISFGLPKTIHWQYPIPEWMRGTSSDMKDWEETRFYKKLANEGDCNPFDGKPSIQTSHVSDGAFLGIMRLMEKLHSTEGVVAHSYGDKAALERIRAIAGPIAVSSGHVKVIQGDEDHLEVQLDYSGTEEIQLHIDQGPDGWTIVDAYLLPIMEV